MSTYGCTPTMMQLHAIRSRAPGHVSASFREMHQLHYHGLGLNPQVLCQSHLMFSLEPSVTKLKSVNVIWLATTTSTSHLVVVSL